MAKKFDFIAIGDIVTDAFIKLESADVHNDEAKAREELCLSFGDKIPYEFVSVVPAVGNCANAAVAAARLGLSTALITNQGDDDIGKAHTETLKHENISTDFVVNQPGKISNYHYVLWFESDRTILVKHQKYDYSLPDIDDPKWIYLTSLSEYTLDFHEKIADYLDAHPTVKLAFQPGTFQMQFGKEKLARIYKRSDAFFCNTDEARRILETKEEDAVKLAKSIATLGPKLVVVTDGPKGAYALDTIANKTLFMPPYPDPRPPYDRTGAGDAYSSTITAALAIGETLETALLWAPINSMSVVQQIGARAGLLDRKQIELYLNSAPADYKPRQI
ncbi:MAG: carbohydrate kinase family protein [Candidatus Paceibacterota bacterium]|jgi:sugar/nucleoside kinase (ribokinase family)